VAQQDRVAQPQTRRSDSLEAREEVDLEAAQALAQQLPDVTFVRNGSRP